jgi:hypothetical protein
MIEILESNTTTDVTHDVKGTIGTDKFHVIVQCRNGKTQTVSFADERLTRFLTEAEKIKIIDHLKKKFDS